MPLTCKECRLGDYLILENDASLTCRVEPKKAGVISYFSEDGELHVFLRYETL